MLTPPLMGANSAAMLTKRKFARDQRRSRRLKQESTTPDDHAETLLRATAVSVSAQAGLSTRMTRIVGWYTVKCVPKWAASTYGFRATASGVEGTSWTLRKRYSEFERLRTALIKRGLQFRCSEGNKGAAATLLARLPITPEAAMILGEDRFPVKGLKSSEPWVMASRQRGLQAWLSAALQVGSIGLHIASDRDDSFPVHVEVRPEYWKLLSNFFRAPELSMAPAPSQIAVATATAVMSAASSCSSSTSDSSDASSASSAADEQEEPATSGMVTRSASSSDEVSALLLSASPPSSARPDGPARRRRSETLRKKQRWIKTVAIEAVAVQQQRSCGKRWSAEGNRFISNDDL